MAQVCTNSTFTTRNVNKNCVLNSEFLECIVDYNLCSQKQLAESRDPLIQVLSPFRCGGTKPSGYLSLSLQTCLDKTNC